MATSSFFKSFEIDSKMAADSFTAIVNKPKILIPIDRSLTSKESKYKSKKKIRRILFTKNNTD